MTTEDVVGALWAEYRAADRIYCTVQDDDFTARFRKQEA